MTRIGASPEPQQPQEKPVQSQQQEKQSPSVFAEYNDKDGKVDTQDVNYTTEQTSSVILNFLQINKGKEWTNSLKFQIDNLINNFNFECAQQAMQDSFNNFAQNARNEFEGFVNNTKKNFEQFSQPAIQGKMHKVEKEVGHLVSILNDDGSSYQIDFKNKTIAKYSPEGELIGEREMTDEEIAMKSQDLINSINNNPEAVKPSKTKENKPSKASEKINEFLEKDKAFSGYVQLVKDLTSEIETLSSVEKRSEALLKRDFIKEQLKQYVDVLLNWQDGHAWDFFERNGQTFTNVSRVTLSSGQPAYKCDEGYFYPSYDGQIGPVRIPEEELNFN